MAGHDMAILLSFHRMIIEPYALKHWMDKFYGYGSWNAAIWFVAYEESGGDLPEEEAEKFNYFYKTHHSAATPTLCDLRQLYQHVAARLDGPRATLFASLYDYRFGTHAVQHGLWKNLISFVHGYNNKKLPDLLEYQKNLFLMPSAKNEALIPLYPLPTHNHAWYYSWLELPQFPFLKSRALFHDHVYDSRMENILQNIMVYKPEVVLMYGMDNINRLKESVQSFFPSAKFKMVKGIKQQIPQHHRADCDETKLLITTQIPALRHNRIETGFDWEALGRLISV
jgi:hypothetical protein